MKKFTYIALASIFINGLLSVYLLKKLYQGYPAPAPVVEQLRTKYRIAIMTPATHPSLQAIEKGFLDVVQQYATCKTYNANGNATLMRAQAEEAVLAEYDLIFTIGGGCTRMSKEVVNKKNKNIPVVFSAVDNPVQLGLITSMEHPGGNMTGVIEIMDVSVQMELLLLLYPHVKKALIIYDPSQGTGLDPEKQRMQTALEQRGVHVSSVQIFQAREIQQKVTVAIQEADVVIILKDNTVVSGLDALVKLCDRYQKPLYASDLDSVDRGAALAYGVEEREFGTRAGKAAVRILTDGIMPGTIACQVLDQFKIKLNVRAAQKQGMRINPLYIQLMKSGVVL